ncbi:MAG: tRNA uridine-5-carboxymethylaminomethyl(34) synthesis GTPase MnmE [Candidatus Eremiobacteraeota bacterium]|nr:tRNA uridine-5-carboxymethylaminomethyl(34) synthesis GTPase MnmE [Candidatus Eremiobacteraeota bacterium]
MRSAHADTIAAIATAPGRGAVAIVRVSGGGARTIAATVCPGTILRERRVQRCAVVGPDGAPIDEGLAVWFMSPRSYTGEDVLELHVHGSPAVARETLLAVLAAGSRLAGPGEFTRRAFEAGKLDLSAAEAVAELIAAEHRSAVRGATARLAGGLALEVERLRALLATVLEELNASLDFPDEVAAPETGALRRRLGAISGALDDLARSWERGRLVREGAAVALVGPPNAGKSSLLNGLLEADRALVSHTPGTTRDTIEESVGLGDGLVARLIDTAGLRPDATGLEAAGIARSRAALAAARLLLIVLDGSRALDAAACALLRETRARERIVYFNKADLGRAAYDAREPPEREALLGSAHERASLQRVRGALHERLSADVIDGARPHLGTARQADAVLEARRSLSLAFETLAAAQPVDLLAADLAAAFAALGAITGRDASEEVLDGVFSRFCVGK